MSFFVVFVSLSLLLLRAFMNTWRGSFSVSFFVDFFNSSLLRAFMNAWRGRVARVDVVGLLDFTCLARCLEGLGVRGCRHFP